MTLDGISQDVRFALRQLTGAPAFALGVVATLALGIGANAMMAGTIDRLLLRAPAHVRDEATLKRLLYHQAGSDSYGSRGSYPTMLDMRGVPAFADVAAMYPTRASLGSGSDAEYVKAAGVTGNYFAMLGVAPQHGRLISPIDDSIAAPARVVVISDGLWRRRFQSDAAILDKQIRIGFNSYTVIGVTPQGFEGVSSPGTDLWVPLSTGATEESWGRRGWNQNRGSYWLEIVARLAPGRTIAEAESQASTVLGRTLAMPPGRAAPLVALSSVIPGRALDRPREIRVSFWLSGVSLLVLLIACVNVANLVLTRTMLRGREVALRAALGASTGRLVRQFFVEALLLALAAGAVALVFVAAMGRLLRSIVLAPAEGGFVDMRVLLLGAAITVLAAVIVSLAPALQLRGANLVTALQQRGGATGRRHPAQVALLGVQALLAVVMLIGAGLFGRSLNRVQSLDLGVDLDRTIIASLDLARLGLTAADNNALYAEFVRRVKQQPGIEDATVATTNPYMAGSGASPWVPGTSREATWSGRGEVAYSATVGPRFFTVTGAKSLKGRDFTESDRAGSEPVVIINRPLEKRLFGDASALDKCIMVDDALCARVIGVLGGVYKFSALDREKMTVFYPFEQETSDGARAGSVLARARGDVSAAMLDVRRAIQSVRPDLPAARVQSARELTDPQFLPWRMGAAMFLIFGGVALLLAGAGLYAVAMYSVTNRSREFAVRIALGAGPRHVTRAAVQGELVSIVAGVIVGSLVALVVAKWSGPLLYQTSPRDPLVIIAAGVAIALVAALAVTIPVRRALRLDPAALLRLEQ